MATAGMRRAPASSAPGARASSASAATSSDTFDWEAALARDPRMPQMHKYMEQILRVNFPAVVEKLRKEEPPASRYAPPAPSPPAPQPQPQHANRAAPVATAPGAASKPSTAAKANGSRDGAARSAAQPQVRGSIAPRQRTAVPPHPAEFKLHASSGDSSSEVDMREVDPMDELSDFEPQPTPPVAESRRTSSAAVLPQANSSSQHAAAGTEAARATQDATGDADDAMDGSGTTEAHDVGMDSDHDSDGSNDDETACVVCSRSENEDQILLCDGCEAEYHLYCLTPPLAEVPQDQDWFCPQCAPAVASASTGAPQSHTAPAPQLTNSQATSSAPSSSSNSSANGSSSSSAPQYKQEQEQEQHPGPPPLSIAQTFETDAERSNELLIHACGCDALKCTDATFHEFCAHMKRFLRSACWASHSDSWRTFRIARATAELFAYHAMQCHTPQCNVPMCDELRAEEMV